MNLLSLSQSLIPSRSPSNPSKPARPSLAGAVLEKLEDRVLLSTVGFVADKSAAKAYREMMMSALGGQAVYMPLQGDQSSFSLLSAGDDLPVVLIRSEDAPAGEYRPGRNESAWFKVTRKGKSESLQVKLQVGGSATPNADYTFSGIDSLEQVGQDWYVYVTVPAGHYTKQFHITAVDDAIVEEVETVDLTVAASENYTIGRLSSATRRIFDNDIEVSIEAIDDEASEDDQELAKFKIIREGDLTDSLNVYYTLDGTATPGVENPDGTFTPADTDYTGVQPDPYGSGFGVITMSAGQSSVDLVLTPIDDGRIEPDETVIVTLAEDPAGIYGFDDPTTLPAAEGEIKDNDVLIVLVAGHDQSDFDNPPLPAAGVGIWGIRDKLIAQGVHQDNIFMTSEDGPTEGESRERVIGKIAAEINNAGDRVLPLAMIGYSHGGGLIHEVADELATRDVDDDDIPDFADEYDLFFTGYIDAFNRPLFIALDAEPEGTGFHMTYYQSEPDGLVGADLLVGTATVGANFNKNFDDPNNSQTHLTIDDLAEVHNGLANGLVGQMG